MKNNCWVYIRLIVYIGIVIALTLAIFDQIYLECIYAKNFGIICPGCGATRATLCIFKGEFLSAIKYNAFYTLIIFPFFIIFTVEDIYVIVKRSIKKTSDISLIEILFGGIVR